MDDFWDHTILVTLTSNITCDLFTQFGGTCTGITGKWSGRILEQGMDSYGLGRWSYVRLHGKNGREIIIVTAYQACKASIRTIGRKLPMHEFITGLTPPPKKSLSAQKRVLENRKLNAKFDEVQSFQESADSQGAAGGGL